VHERNYDTFPSRAFMSAPPGGLVVSLDFELEWGLRDTLAAGGGYRDQLLGAREAVPRILDLFAEFEVHATWATVGFLFAESREELEHYAPTMKPSYHDARLDPYRAAVGENEAEDPIHYAPSLLREIAARPHQEIASHTYSHYYCLEPGQTRAAFDADLRSAVAIARARGVTLRSLVFPRNQYRPDYLPALASNGFVAFRGAEANRLNRPRAGAFAAPWVRAARLVDSYLPVTGDGLLPWSGLTERDGLVDVPASRFLRPASGALGFAEPARVARITAGLRRAAEAGTLYHLWWHPHNFGVRTDENVSNLRSVLETHARLRDRYGFASYTMLEVASAVAERSASSRA
jgi:peptidoglycan/xylan/chitin deacetylase (PgdA/CDA1 family)